MKIFLMVLFIFMFSCASDRCTDGKCEKEIVYKYGMSVVLSVDSSNGEILWSLQFEGEKVEIEGLSDASGQVWLRLDDPCFEEPRVLIFDVDNAREVNKDDYEISKKENSCVIIETEYDEIYLSKGICVASKDNILKGYDIINGELLWEKEDGADGISVIDEIIIKISEVVISGENVFRISRLSPLTGDEIWIHQHYEPVSFLGSDGFGAIFLDEVAFSLSLSQGDLLWRMKDLEWGWAFDPDRDGGKVLDNKIYLKRQDFPLSPCSEEG